MDIGLISESLIDAHNRALIAALQRDARLSYSALAREVGLSQPAVAERVRRLEEAGILQRYGAVVSRAKVGLPITAFLRLSCAGEKYRAVAAMSQDLPQVLECHHVTGEDCFFLKLAASTLGDLEQVVERFRAHGRAVVTIALSSVVEDKPVTVVGAARGKER
ncbi:MAG: Lrp/AsnC family transcriptional regulator [Rickettsiales bacterium]